MINTTRDPAKQCRIGTPVPVVPQDCTMDQLRKFFLRYDTNRDGKLSRKELTDAFYQLGATIPCWRAGRALKRADDNGDGYISEEEVDKLVVYAIELGYIVTK